MTLRPALCLVVLGWVACGDHADGENDSGVPDMGAADDMLAGDGGGTIYAQLTMSGCQSLTMVGNIPRCSGPAPLAITLVPISSMGVDAWSWALPGSDIDTSHLPMPHAIYLLPGNFAVGLTVGGSFGSASAEGEVAVSPAATGAACQTSEQCGFGHSCLCASSTDAGVPCPPALAEGMCTRTCDGVPCPPGERCVDLSRSGTAVPDGGVEDVWRHPLCLANCTVAADCRPGLHCRELPVLDDGQPAGGTFSWKKACFVELLGDVGAACMSAEETWEPKACLLGICLPFGARGICSADCGGELCSAGAVCASFTGDPEHPRCIARCGPGRICDEAQQGDPLLACRQANPDAGVLGFSVPVGESPGGTYCTPKPCMHASDCAPVGRCDGPDGGASFCRARTDAGSWPF